MPISDRDRYAFKYVNGHPANANKGLPTVMAFGVLADVETGFPTLLAEMTLTTAFRTAAASAIAAEALARPDSRVMGMIGCGAQSEFQAIAFHKLLGIDEVRIFDIDGTAMGKLARNLSHIPELKMTPVGSSADAARSADIVTTCTADKALATILTPDMVEPGMHINAVGGDCPGKTELHFDVHRNARIFVEFEPQTRIEGDIQQLPGDHPVHELWRVIAGKEAGRHSDEQVTVFDSVGFALEDYSALRYVHELAAEFDEGEDIGACPCARGPERPVRHDAESLHRARKAMIQTRRPIHIINVPLDLGASRRGTDAGPSAFRVAGLRNAIRSLGYSMVKETDVSIPSMETLPPGNSNARFKDEILAACTLLAEHTRDALEAGEWPLVIGGDHSIAMGTVSGVSAHLKTLDRRLGVIWFDAHGDMNLPETSPSGNVHGMPLAHLLGYGNTKLSTILGANPAVDAKNVVLIGIRDIDDLERKFIRESGVTAFHHARNRPTRHEPGGGHGA